MEVDGSPTQILDLLFDYDDGVLRGELEDVRTVDFSDLDFDLLQNPLFDALLPDDIIKSHAPIKRDIELSTPTVHHHDHAYSCHKSPSEHSDSGVSLDSMADSPRNSTDGIDTAPSCDAFINQLDANPLSFEDINMQDINVDFSCVDSQHFIDNLAVLTALPQDKDVTVNLDSSSDSDSACTYDPSYITVNTGDMHNIQILKMSSSMKESLPFTVQDIGCDVTSTSSSHKQPELQLTAEELDLLSREGVSLPNHLPLTKDEERVLKSVRRKIRNKVSAKESRKRKMEYVDGLERRVKICTSENQHLHKKVGSLEKQNVSLLTQLKKLQVMVLSKSKGPTPTTTCLAVLLLSFALLVIPNCGIFSSRKSSSELKQMPMPGNSRSLLHQNDPITGMDEDPYGISMKPGPPWDDKSPAVRIPKAQIFIDELDVPEAAEVNYTIDGVVTSQGENSKSDIHPDVPSDTNPAVQSAQVSYKDTQEEFKHKEQEVNV